MHDNYLRMTSYTGLTVGATTLPAAAPAPVACTLCLCCFTTVLTRYFCRTRSEHGAASQSQVDLAVSDVAHPAERARDTQPIEPLPASTHLALHALRDLGRDVGDEL